LVDEILQLVSREMAKDLESS